MATELIAGLHVRETQFWSVRGQPRNGMCSENGLASVETLAGGRYVWTGTIFERMEDAKQLLADNGASDIDQQNARLIADGFKTIVHRYAGDEWPGAVTWIISMLQQGLGVVIMTSNGAALVDSITGKPNWPSHTPLRYHTVSGHGFHPGGFSQHAQRVLPMGIWCADGDAQAEGNVLQFYATAVLQAAKICAAIAVYPQQGATNMGLYSGWQYDEAKHVLTAPNGVTAQEGFAAFVVQEQIAGRWPQTRIVIDNAEQSGTPGTPNYETWQYCTDGELYWKAGASVIFRPNTFRILSLEKALKEANALIDQLHQEHGNGSAASEAVAAFLGDPTMAAFLAAFDKLRKVDNFTL